MCWIDIYLRTPDIITHDAGKNFVNKEFKQYIIILRTVIKGVPVEAHNSVGMVKHYYGPLRRIYHIIIIKLLDINKDMALQMAFKAINNSASPDSFIPTLLVFRVYLYMV